MTAFGWASILLCVGVFLRAKVSFLRKMLVPASVIAGVLGLGFVNLSSALGVDVGTSSSMYTEMVNHLFTVSFISISLTGTPENKKSHSKDVLKGAVALGLIWCFLYAVTPILAAGVIAGMGKGTDMNRIYGMLIPFAFCQGPGQAASYGAILEQFGWRMQVWWELPLLPLAFFLLFWLEFLRQRWGLKKELPDIVKNWIYGLKKGI